MNGPTWESIMQPRPQPDEASRRDPSKIAIAGITGALIGGAGGAALGSSGGTAATVWGAITGAAIVGAGEAVTDATRTPGTAKPFGWRIVSSAALAAVLGWLVDLVAPDLHLAVYGALFGLIYGAIGFRLTKLALGAAVGIAVGFALEAVWPEAGLAWVAAITAVVYRILAALIYRGREQVAIMGEAVPPSDLEFVVPFAARSRYVGVDYLKQYADLTGADFVRSPEDVGIVSSFDDLRGPAFDPAVVHPLIREFYEHTSRFHLSITPEWRAWMKPVYLAYRSTIARPIGQANVPFDVEEVQHGVRSWIDTIDLDHSGGIDFRAWVRAYDNTNEPLYVGIYTVLRREEVGYVSVGFPLPDGNFTATLLPIANRGDGLLLSSRSELAYPGHYLSAVEAENESMTTLRLSSFNEEIDVFVEADELKTDHRFYLGGVRFLTLHYAIERIAATG
jgi:hypothetical protein